MALHTIANVTISTAGTAVALAASRTSASWVNIQALSTNAGAVYVGDSAVSNSSGTQWGVRLTAGSSFLFPVMASTSYDLKVIFANADTNADKVAVTYCLR